MYHLLVTYKAKDENTAKKFYRNVKDAGIISCSQEETGCIMYEYFFSAERPNEVLLVESWTDRDSQAVHAAMPHLKKLAEIKSRYGIETTLKEL